jgi:hypothetical protein
MRMSTQTQPVRLAKRLVNLATDLETTPEPIRYVQTIIDELPSAKIAERLETYLITGDEEYTKVSQSEAFKAIVYASKPIIGAPVRYNGEIVPTPAPGDEADIPVIISRPLLFDELLIMYYQDSGLERFEFDEGTQERVVHAPLSLNWGEPSREYRLLGESNNKAFYWPDDTDLPSELKPWITRTPSERTTLINGLMRQGHRIAALEGLTLDPSKIYTDGINDLGFCVLTDEQMAAVNTELGLDADPYQGTIWFEDGSYAKGSIVSESSSRMKPGYYGGVKRPYGASASTISTRGSIMDSFTLVPWSASVNRQQMDFADLPFPVREQLPDPDTFSKAVTGFPPYIQSLNEQLISSIGQLFKKCPIKGYAGKVSVGVADAPVQFIVRGPKVKEHIQTMVMLFNPSLPVHTSLMKVKVQFIRDENAVGNLIQLNLHSANHPFIDQWWTKWAGRDNDGDGVVLTSDPIVMKHAVWPDMIQWHDTTQYKSTADVPVADEETCIRLATERIRTYAGRIGVLDKLARRIHRQDPELFTWEMRVLLSEAIQRSISAQKKNSGMDTFSGYAWLLDQLPEGSTDWLFHNLHDDIDEVPVRVRAYLNDRAEVGIPDFEELFKELEDVAVAMPDHFKAAQDILGLLQEIPKDNYHRFKAQGRELYAKHQARAPESQIKEVLQFISRSKQVWRMGKASSLIDIHLSYNQKSDVISSWARDLSKRVSTKLLVGTMIKNFSLNLLSHILDIQDLEQLGLLSGYYLPVCTSSELRVGMIGKRGSFAALITHPHFISVLKENSNYRIENIHQLSGSNWITKTTNRMKVSTHMLHVKEVK